jgi:hypothetical protein
VYRKVSETAGLRTRWHTFEFETEEDYEQLCFWHGHDGWEFVRCENNRVTFKITTNKDKYR